MEEKKVLKVDASCSKGIGNWQLFFSIGGWLLLIGGIITAVVGLSDANSYRPDYSTLIVGISICVLSLVFLFNSALLKGLNALVQGAEYKKAIIDEEYDVQIIETESYFG